MYFVTQDKHNVINLDKATDLIIENALQNFGGTMSLPETIQTWIRTQYRRFPEQAKEISFLVVNYSTEKVASHAGHLLLGVFMSTKDAEAAMEQLISGMAVGKVIFKADEIKGLVKDFTI